MFALALSPGVLRQSGPFSLPLRRFRHFKSHRTVRIQLLTDIERLGLSGSLHNVNPGFMRNILYPRRMARYIDHSGPLLLNSSPLSSNPSPSPSPSPLSYPNPSPATVSIDSGLANALKALPEITLERNARPNPYAAHTTDCLLYRPMTMEMVADHLRETFEIKHLHPPYAVLCPKSDGHHRPRLMSTGLHVVEVRLRDGSVVPVRIRVQRKVYG